MEILVIGAVAGFVLAVMFELADDWTRKHGASARLATIYARRLVRIGVFGGVWLVFVYLQMSAVCEGFMDFVALIILTGILVMTGLILVVTRSIRFRTLVLCALGMALTLPASIVLPAVEYHFAAERLKTISAALDRYRSDHGSFPGELSELTPRYLKRIPSAVVLLALREPHYSRSSPQAYEVNYQLVCGPEVSVDHANQTGVENAPAGRENYRRTEPVP